MIEYNKLYQVSNSYARALFETACANNKLDEIFDQFMKIDEIISDRDISSLFAKFYVPEELGKKFIQTIEAKIKLDLALKNLLQLLFSNNKAIAIRYVFKAFKKLALQEQQRQELIITFSREEDKKMAPAIVKKLEQNLNKKFLVKLDINKDLLSGFTLQIDSMFLDASLDNILEKHQQNILKQITNF